MSSITVLQAFLWEKLSVYDRIVSENLKRRRDEYQTIFNMNFRPKDDLRMELIV